MGKKKNDAKSIGSMLADLRWSKVSAEDRKVLGRKLTDARLMKRSNDRKQPHVVPSESNDRSINPVVNGAVRDDH